MKRFSVLPLLLVALAACSDDSGSGSSATTAAPAASAPGYTTLTPADGAELIGLRGAALTIIDVRTPEEFATGHLQGAVNSDLEGGQFSAYIATLDKTAAYAVYCHSGRRAALAAQAMVDAGFTEVYDLGGIVDLQAAGYAVVQ